MGKKVGVIIPVKHNLTTPEFEYMDKCLESIKTQTYGSVFFYSYQSENGIAHNINEAAREAIVAGCEFLFVMSADDWMQPTCVQRAMEEFEKDPSVGFVSVGIRYHPSGQVVSTKRGITYKSQLDRNQVVCFCLYPVRIWHEFGGYSEHFKDIAPSSLEDYDLLTRVMKYYKYSVVSTPEVNYRIHGEQTLAKLNGELNKRLKLRFNELR